MAMAMETGTVHAQTASLIIPRPKQMTVEPAQAAFNIGAHTRLIVREGATEEDRRGARLLQAEIQAQFGIQAPIEAAGSGALEDAILFGEAGAAGGELGRRLAAASAPDKPEGYAVVVSPTGVTVAGHDTAGTLWGAETVIQLLGRGRKGAMVRPVAVHDWPTLRLRAVHLFHGQNALPFQEKLIERVLTRFKMNGLFIQAEQVRWDADPEVAPKWAGTKAQIREEIGFARARGMTLYPLIEGYGHMEWLFNRERNRDFAEDPETPYAVDFSNPAAVAYLDRFVGEAADLFGAPALHVGLDEVTMRGRFPYRSKPQSYSDLIVGAVNHWHDLLAKRGMQTWMWADMALDHADVAPDWGSAPTAADAARVRDGIPKDTVMVDWQYGDLPKYPSLRRLKDAGFTNIVAATWFAPEDIRKFTRAAAGIGALGAIQTTWAGYESNESVLATKERRQFEAMVLAADYFWNGGEGPAPSDLPYDPAKVFARQWQAPASARK